jgi:hypothetical protein
MGTLGKRWKSKISDERRKQIIETNKRVFTGRKLTQEHKNKLKLNNAKYWLGKKRPEIKNFFTMKGKHHTKETKQKIKKHNVKYWLGKKRPPLSKEHIKIIRKVNLGKQYTKGMKFFRKGWENTPLNKKIRNSPEYILWRKACMERDDFTDQKTGQRGGELRVHHINNFADFPELRFAIDNGITLSKESHKLFHKIYGKRNNSREQLTEFLKN